MSEGKKRVAKEQEDVLAQKGGAIASERGLQVYDDDAVPEGPLGAGTGGSGTAERAARIGNAQLEAEGKKEPSRERPETG